MRRRRRWRRGAFTFLGLPAAGILAAFVIVHFAAGDRESRRRVEESQAAKAAQSPTLRLLTLNLAHGRGDSFFQAFLSESAIRDNLDDVARALAGAEPHVVALQEADGPSSWSGRFDHVERLAQRASFPYRARAENVRGLGISYGTAILARWPLEGAVAVTFPLRGPTFTKGFIKATIEWPLGGGDGGAAPARKVAVDVVSVHLEFSRASVRAAQFDEIAARLASRTNPLIILGDFNCGWEGKGTVSDLAGRLGLSAYRPEAEDLATFPLTGRRLDWILISSELEFVSYATLPDVVSDHLAVLAEVRLR